jgi:signal transduction histidine kinase/CheY-like chemotaxis protein
MDIKANGMTDGTHAPGNNTAAATADGSLDVIEVDTVIEEEDDDFTDDPLFQPIKPTGLLMRESRKKEIFRKAMRMHPRIQKEFNDECMDGAIPSIGCWQWRLKDGRLIWSPGMFKVMGRDPVLGAPTFEEAHLKFIDGAEQDKYLAEMAPVMEGKSDSAYFTLQCVRPGGERYFASGVTLPILDETGSITEICGYLKDHNTHQRCMASEQSPSSGTDLEQDMVLEIARKERIMHEKALKDKNNFIAYVFHEVRNPINAVYLGLQTLTEELDDLDMKEIADIMIISTERAISILNDTLDYSKFELGTVHLNKILIPISAFVTECVTEHKSQVQQRGLSITVEKGNDAVCEIDRSRMMQVMNNLFSNAIKFTAPDGNINVKFDHNAVESKSTISVSDSGIGIKDDDQSRIFTPYNQIDNPTAAKKGMGIGLSISRKIVNAHYGDLTVESVIGQGSTFTISIPAVKRIENCTLEGRNGGKDRTPGELNGMHVLVVDDDAVNRIMLSKILKKHGCTVETMKDGDEFLQWTRGPHAGIDLVILDDFMPRLDGSKAIGIAREEGFGGAVLMLTGNMHKTLADCGANHVIFKPLKFREFQEYIETNEL